VLRRDDGPGVSAWLAGFASLALPWLGAGLGATGFLLIARHQSVGWWCISAGGALLIGWILIDWVWARPAAIESDEPGLNRRAEQLVGRVLEVQEAIDGGRGKVRAGDTLWPAEGPDMPAGAEARVIAARGTALLVERA